MWQKNVALLLQCNRALDYCANYMKFKALQRYCLIAFYNLTEGIETAERRLRDPFLRRNNPKKDD